MRPSASDIYGMPPSRPEDYEALDLDLIRRRWDEKAARWDADLANDDCHLNEDDAYRRFMDEARAAIDHRAAFCRDKRLVDLGCGTGLVLAQFVDRFSGGVGIDISPRMLAVARDRLPGTRFIEGNCFALADHVTGAGAVLSRGVLLSHYGRRLAGRLLRQVRLALVPQGGFAILDFLNTAARELYQTNPDNKTYYSSDELSELAMAAGFGRATVLGQPERRVLVLLAEDPSSEGGGKPEQPRRQGS